MEGCLKTGLCAEEVVTTASMKTPLYDRLLHTGIWESIVASPGKQFNCTGPEFCDGGMLQLSEIGGTTLKMVFTNFSS